MSRPVALPRVQTLSRPPACWRWLFVLPSRPKTGLEPPSEGRMSAQLELDAKASKTRYAVHGAPHNGSCWLSHPIPIAQTCAPQRVVLIPFSDETVARIASASKRAV